MSAPLEGVVHRQHTLENGLVISAEIDPQAVFIFYVNVFFIEVKASAFESDVVLNNGTDGGDDVEIIKVFQRKLW